MANMLIDSEKLIAYLSGNNNETAESVIPYVLDNSTPAENTSDGYHTFGELYYHRMVLFACICNSNPHIAWKSKHHSDGTMYDGMFICGIDTPFGQATYHYEDKYWNCFRVKTLDFAPEWDGHTPEEAIERLAKYGGCYGRADE